MLNRTSPDSRPELVFTAIEIKVLDRVERHRISRCVRRRSVSSYLICLARLGGYLDRASDSPPGNTVIWRGMARLADMVLGARIAEHET